MSERSVLIENGAIWDGSLVRREPLLVRGERIVATGPEAAERAGAAERLDIADGLVVPGFQDSHVHPHNAGRTLIGCDLSEGSTIDDYLVAIAAYARSHPEREWIVGAGWSMDAFEGGIPHAALLDLVVPDRPVFLMNRDGHGAWVSAAALEKAGIDDATPDPADGRIERDAAGRAVGCLQEGATRLVADLLPPVTDEDLDRAFEAAQSRLLGWGVTAWQDAMVGAHGDAPDNLGSYLRLDGAGRLIARVRGAQWWDRSRGVEQIPELVVRRERSSTAARFRADAVKIMVDGVAENFTAALLDPYLDPHGHATRGRGTDFVPADELGEIVRELDALGFQIHFHALGDRGVRNALDALATARRANGARDSRHHLAHLQLVDPADLGRFAALDAVANIQPYWARHEPQVDELTSPYLGPERAARQYPFGALAAAGARLASGSDWPVSTADPLAIIHTAVNRSRLGATGAARRPLGGEHALSLADALRAHTQGGAHINHLDETGRIAPGMLADLAVLDRDIFAHPADEIGAASVTHTLVGGEIVSRRD